MSSERPERDRFVHALLSPLTTLQGAAGLLRRRVEGHADPSVEALLASMERSCERLRALAELILAGTTVSGERVLIDLPLAELPLAGAQPTTASRHSSASPAPLHVAVDSLAHTPVSNHVLVIAAPGSSAEAYGAALRAMGHAVNFAEQSTDGLDQARRLRPALVLLDPQVDSRGELALRVLEEDPDIKGVPLAVVAPEPAPGTPQAMLTLAPDLEPGAAAELLRRALTPGRTGREDRPHILIVDDEPDIANMMALQFSDEGYQTTTVHSGTEVLRVVREQQFGLILLDVMMPDIDGFTALGGLRAQPESQLTPIILVSAIDSPAEKVRGLQLGADDYITKPFSAAELSARVQAVFRRSEREGGANPSTRLPGNVAIERAISQRIADGAPFAVCYGDLDHFKAYNDSYGFLKGDAVIQRTAQILLDAVRGQGNPDDFVGHIGGDDFVVITTPERVGPICEAATSQFDETAPLFYDAETRDRGHISGVDRQGRPTQFPLVSITFAVVTSARRRFSHPGEVAQRAVEAKKRAKLIPGSIYLIED
jgi:DNA-binding response OmpR family regulator